ncbi:MAG: primosomal protein N', partial [Anaerolineae bacterium]|nr:primosomal protein N' [Anaerolineae bacterium]
GDTLYTLVEEDAEGKSDAQNRIISLLRRRGPLRGKQLGRALPRKNWQSSMRGLVKRGIVQQDPTLLHPDVKPKMIRTAQLTIPAARIPNVTPHLGRESRRANVLEVLLATENSQMSESELRSAAGCTAAPIKTLETADAVASVPGSSGVELAVPPQEITERLAAGDFARAPAQTKVLETLLEKTQPVRAKDLNASARRALEKKGVVRQWSKPAVVTLQLTSAEAREMIIDLRGGKHYLAMLTLLAERGDPVAIRAVYKETGTTLKHVQRLAEDGLITLGEEETLRDPLEGQAFVLTVPPPLTTDQEHIWSDVQAYMDSVHWGEASPPPDTSGVFLLHGVTGSGKTEIYLRAVERALAQGRQAIVLVPEIALTPQTVQRFAARFPGRVAVVHSHLTPGERYDTWRRARSGAVHVVVGARSALFTPLPNVGLVILDEEHDDSYKQTPPIPPPYYHARETAIQLMRIMRGTVLVGSATPDVVTYFRAEQKQYRLITLPKRIIAHRERIAEQVRRLNAPDARYHPTDAADAVSAELPLVHVVDMRQELRAGNRSIFSRALHTALNDVLARGEQAILFLNRRGTATFIMCRDCGYIAMCPRCNTPLTYHGPRHKLICHYCGYTRDHISVCPDCGSERIRHFGQGTELIEAAVKKEFSAARTIRWDRDTASKRNAHEVILHQFSTRRADILVGTQMIAKGLDLPQVTLVGIVSADTALGLPDYRAGERTFQLLTQVAGRAGRGALGGRVILQSYMPEHYAIQAAAEHDYERFYRQELAYREDQQYPPYRRLARIVFQFPTADLAEYEAQRAKRILEQRIAEKQFTATEVIGPTPCFFAKRNNLHRWHLVLRSANPAAVLATLDAAEGWFIDIDPVDLL